MPKALRLTMPIVMPVAMLIVLGGAGACRTRSGDAELNAVPAPSAAPGEPTASAGAATTRSLMRRTDWEPAGTLLSSSFPGTDASWLVGDDEASVWTLPGSSPHRRSIRRGQRLYPNHMQYSVKTREQFTAFKLRLSFRFENEPLDGMPLTWIGNSGVYIFGLYEVQLFRTGFFTDAVELDAAALPDGYFAKAVNGQALRLPINQFLCGSLYGHGSGGDPFAGAPQTAEGAYANPCAAKRVWHDLEIAFVPALFQGDRKLTCAKIAVSIDDQKLYFDGRDVYPLPGPTGSQRRQPERPSGPIALQDHGSRVSFAAITVDTDWRPDATWQDVPCPGR